MRMYHRNYRSRYLTDLREIDGSFMKQCYSLTSVSLPPEIQSIGHEFLHECSSLKKLDMNYRNVNSIGSMFLYRCRSFKTFPMSLLEHCKVVRKGFMFGTIGS